MFRGSAARHRSFKTDITKFSINFNRKAYSNVLEVLDICLELPRDSKKYFGFCN